MALTDADKRRIMKEASYHLKKKIWLEKNLRRDINKFFINQNGAVKVRLSDGDVYDASEDVNELEDILEEHYNRASPIFIPLIINLLNRNLKRLTGGSNIDIDTDALDAKIKSRIRSEVANTSKIVTSTTSRIIRNAISVLDSDDVTKHSDRGKYVFEKLEAKRRMRADVIAITETNKAVEGAKDATAKEHRDMLFSDVKKASRDGTIVTLLTSGKAWVTMMDKAVRAWHANALFQERRFDEPFEVMREYLMFPGDTALGATPMNINRCRCSSIPFLI